MHFRTKQAGIKPFAMQKVRWSVQQIDARDCVASMLCGSKRLWSFGGYCVETMGWFLAGENAQWHAMLAV
jgi:hypothetical protein